MRQHILFVDDELYVQQSLQRTLRGKSAEWKMQFVGDADAALEAMETCDFDAVVTDVLMPGKTGFELLTIIRSQEHTQDVPVIILSGAHEVDLKRRALDLGASDLLNKPVCAADLIARLGSVLRLKSYQDEIKRQNAELEARVRERTLALAASQQEIIWRLAKAGEYRDEETGNHIIRVGRYCQVIGEALGLDRPFIEMLTQTSPLHDIGKIGIPDSVLLKPGKLTPEEWQIMQQHCVIGVRILRENLLYPLPYLIPAEEIPTGETAISSFYVTTEGTRLANPLLEMAATIALSHHEKWDGSGYPQRLAGEAIPLEARIVALADVYDALGATRPYKPAYTESEVLALMADGVGRHFDPFAYAGFLRSLDLLRAIREEYPESKTMYRQKAA